MKTVLTQVWTRRRSRSDRPTFALVMVMLILAMATMGADLLVPVRSLVGGQVVGRRVTLTLLDPGAVSSGPWLLSGDAYSTNTGPSGSVTISNVLNGGYRLDISGSPGRSYPIGVPDTNGLINVVALIGATNTMPYFYTALQIDDLLANFTPGNGNGSGVTLDQVTNVVTNEIQALTLDPTNVTSPLVVTNAGTASGVAINPTNGSVTATGTVTAGSFVANNLVTTNNGVIKAVVVGANSFSNGVLTVVGTGGTTASLSGGTLTINSSTSGGSTTTATNWDVSLFPRLWGAWLFNAAAAFATLPVAAGDWGTMDGFGATSVSGSGYVVMGTGTTTGNHQGDNSSSRFSTNNAVCTMEFAITNISNVRVWSGWSSVDKDSISTSSSPSADTMAFRYDTGAGDSKFKFQTRDSGGNVTTTDTGITPTANTFYVCTVKAVPSLGWVGYINGTAVATNTLTTATSVIMPVIAVTTLENASKGLNVRGAYFQSN